jgi:glycosyltransferase involved in cell wall biosynthesis
MAGGSASGEGHHVVTGGIERRMRRVPTLLYLVGEDYYFVSHRLPVARAARDAGYRVVVATRVAGERDRLEREGFEVVALRHLRRGAAGPLQDARLVRELVGVYRQVRPDLVHHVALKPVLYGGVAARLTGVPASVSAFAGLGWAFTQQGRRARAMERALGAAFRVVLDAPGSIVLFQNGDDAATLTRNRAVRPDQIRIIRGSGVDVERFAPGAAGRGDGPVVVAFGARMLLDKGVVELVEAARELHARAVPVEVRLYGEPDPENPASLDRATLDGWNREGVVRWLGGTRDMAGALRQADVACLPSYREGLPKFLLEGASVGLPLVATDVPGCREIVRPGVNGLLVPARDPRALARAIETLVRDPAARARMGNASRAIAVQEFSEAQVARATLELYAQARDRVG